MRTGTNDAKFQVKGCVFVSHVGRTISCVCVYVIGRTHESAYESHQNPILDSYSNAMNVFISHTHSISAGKTPNCLPLFQLFICHFIFCVITAARLRLGVSPPQLKEMENHFTSAKIKHHLETELLRCLM